MIIITINTDSAAFQDEAGDASGRDYLTREVLRMLESADFYEGGPLRDINGNTVGNVTIKEG